jgi:gluconolactonase
MVDHIQPVLHFGDLPFTEGPSFDRDGNLFLCMRRDGYVAKVATDGTVSRFFTTGQQPNGSRFHRDGRLFVAELRLKQILVAAPDGSVEVFVDACDGRPLLGPNDLVFDRSGVLYFTDPHGSSAANPIGGLCRCTADRRASRIADGIAYPNGLALSTDERVLYVAEMGRHRILRYDLAADGSVGRPDVLAELSGGVGPDGMALDADGNLYVAQHGAGTIAVVSSDGRQLAALPAGGSKPTNCAFHGASLYVTEDDSRGVQRLDLGVAGWPLFHERT